MAKAQRKLSVRPVVARNGPLESRAIQGKGSSLTVAPVARRISLRAPQASLAALGRALGLTLPRKPKTSAISGTRAALWLGPDEWLVIDDGGDPLADCATVSQLHSAVDISHRNVAILVSGARAEDVLSAGVPQDISLPRFPVGACSRTILAKTEIVLLRTGETEFRVECWRSFSDYAFDFLENAARGI